VRNPYTYGSEGENGTDEGHPDSEGERDGKKHWNMYKLHQ
jgi:hypothetical protein